MQDLYEKFHDKEKRVIFTSKSIVQKLIVQQQRHIKSIKHDTLSDICINDVRKHIMSPVDLTVAVKTPTRFRTLAFQQRRSSKDKILINENPSLIVIRNTLSMIRITRTAKKANAVTKNIMEKDLFTACE